MKKSIVLTVLFLLWSSNISWAGIQMNFISVPDALQDPLNGFTVNYSMSGSKIGAGAAVAQLTFYLSESPDGSTGVAQLFSQQIPLNGSGLGPYFPPSGTQSQFISRFSMPSSTVDLLEAITDSCQPLAFYILGQVDFSISSDQSLLGSNKLPDFTFTGGTINPSVIQPGGTTSISFDLFTPCPTDRSSTVGIFLADADLQPLAFIGGVSIGAGAGTFKLPPTPITFSPFIPPGLYHIVLIADIDDVIVESSEDNNAGVFVLNIQSNLQADSERDSGELEPDVEFPIDVTLDSYDGAGDLPDRNYIEDSRLTDVDYPVP